MARKKIIKKIEKSKTLLIEKDRLSNVKEQRKALETTFQGLEDFIVIANNKLKGLKVKIINSNSLLKLKEKEIGSSNKKIAILKNNFNDIENKISMIDNDRKIKEEKNKEDFLVLDRELRNIRDDIIKQDLSFIEMKEIFKDKESEIKKRIKQKIIQSKQLDIDIDNKKNDIRLLKRVYRIKNDKINVLNDSIITKKKVIETLDSKKEIVTVLCENIKKLKKEEEIAKKKRDKEEKLLNERKGFSEALDIKKATIDEEKKSLELKAKTLQKHFDKNQIPIKVYPLNF